MKFFVLILFAFSPFFLNAQIINWSNPIDVANSSFSNKFPRIVQNENDEIFVTWGGNNNVYFSKLQVNTFSNPIKINSTNLPAYVADWTGAELAARNDTIYVVFMHDVWKQKTFISRSFDGGLNFSVPNNLENYPDSTSRFPIVAFQHNGQPLISFMKMDTNGKEPHYVLRKSNDYGVSFYDEIKLGTSIGEACDCCPASIKAKDNFVGVFYRNNINDIRDIYCALSNNNANSFTPFAIDNSNWFIQSCPSSGPDAILVNDSLYSVFLSGNKCYLSRSSISNASLNSVSQLGASIGIQNQNFPRIDNDNNKTAIVWRGQNAGSKVMLSYTNDIRNGFFEIQDTISSGNIVSADVTLTSDAIHIVWQDISAGTVKYIRGSLAAQQVKEKDYENNFFLFPNPAKDILHLNTNENIREIKMVNSFGKVILSTSFKETIDISTLAQGQYFLYCYIKSNTFFVKPFIKLD